MTTAAPRRRRSPSDILARGAAASLVPLAALTFACLESAVLIAAGQFAAMFGGR